MVTYTDSNAMLKSLIIKLSELKKNIISVTNTDNITIKYVFGLVH